MLNRETCVTGYQPKGSGQYFCLKDLPMQPGTIKGHQANSKTETVIAAREQSTSEAGKDCFSKPPGAAKKKCQEGHESGKAEDSKNMRTKTVDGKSMRTFPIRKDYGKNSLKTPADHHRPRDERRPFQQRHSSQNSFSGISSFVCLLPQKPAEFYLPTLPTKKRAANLRI